MLLIHYTGITLAFFCGCMFDDETATRTVSNFFLLFFMLTSGGFANAATFPWFINKLMYLSPLRYGNEAMFRRLTLHIEEPLRSKVLE